jgi:hypothetical protein
LPLLNGRNTAVRFYLDTTRAAKTLLAALDVEIQYHDGSTRRKVLVGENTTGGGGLLQQRRTTGDALRQSLVVRRTGADGSFDFVIPGRVLVDAASARLSLSEVNRGIVARRLSTVDIRFEDARSIGVNFVRIHGLGAAAGAGVPPPAEPGRSFMAQFLKDIYPVGEVLTGRFPIPFGVDSGFANCNSFLSAISAAFVDSTSESERVLPADYWTNLYLLQSTPPDCAGLGFYHQPHAMLMNVFDAPHEIGHTMGLNHVTDFHGEDGFENWPYLHGSIGAVEESKGYNQGVFGLLVNLTPDTVGADLITDWGTWDVGPVPPCRGDASSLFPDCSAGDVNMMHDFMAYGAGDNLPKWGAIASTRWTSDINYHRVARFLDSCIVLDPENRFWGPPPVQEATISTNPACWAGREGPGDPPDDGGAVRSDALVLSGIIAPAGVVGSFGVLRKPVLRSALGDSKGDLELRMFDANAQLLQAIPFRTLTTPAEEEAPEGRAFLVAVPWEPELSFITITDDQEWTMFERSVSANPPAIKLLSPKPGEIWHADQQPEIKWLAYDLDQDPLRVLIQFSADGGKSWQPIASLDAAEKQYVPDLSSVEATDNAMIYISVTDGLGSDAVLMSGPFSVLPRDDQGDPIPPPGK